MTRVLQLLNLAAKTKKIVAGLGDPMKGRHLSQSALRSVSKTIRPGPVAVVGGRLTWTWSIDGSILARWTCIAWRLRGSDEARASHRLGYRHPFAWHDPTMGYRPSSAGLGGAAVVLRRGQGFHSSVTFSLPPVISRAWERETRLFALLETAVAVVKPEL